MAKDKRIDDTITELGKASLTAKQQGALKVLKQALGDASAADYSVEARPAGCKGRYRFLDEDDRAAVEKEIKP